MSDRIIRQETVDNEINLAFSKNNIDKFACILRDLFWDFENMGQTQASLTCTLKGQSIFLTADPNALNHFKALQCWASYDYKYAEKYLDKCKTYIIE